MRQHATACRGAGEGIVAVPIRAPIMDVWDKGGAPGAPIGVIRT
jgi:hypothetical protein